ncbi:hypothetical protein NC653_003538 [Populus alba x Populus x berolinensis]|uniref:Pentatricopeptide repeat-containing protein n=1 Tax=Populus alba x Populus x berolinensis TaxID=444605 RepID=A0AAD6RTM0_9ROSI|nr:hypothetical protein NC653_003538 [Populus alba x Populus x berolinensis]
MKKWRKSWNKGWVARNVVTCSILMVIYVKQGQAKMILDVLEEMRMKGFSPSAGCITVFCFVDLSRKGRREWSSQVLCRIKREAFEKGNWKGC